LIGKRLDVQATFCPPTTSAKIYKLLATTTVVSGNIMNLLAYRDLYGALDLGYFVYIDNIGMVAAAVYMLLSMLNTILGARQPWDKVEGRLRWVWMAFIVASHTQVLMSITFWALVFDGNVNNLSFLTYMKYGGIAAQVIFDGMSINRIPLLWMNWWGMLWLMNLCYFFFFAPLYSFFFCSDLAIPGASTALYSWLDWKGDWEFALVAGVVVVFALSPAVFLILWLMSLYSWPTCFCCQKESRRYLLSDAQRRKLKAAKQEAHRKKKEKEAKKSEELALLIKDPMALLPDKTGGGGGSNSSSDMNGNSIGAFLNRNRRPRRDNNDDVTVMSSVMSLGSSSKSLQLSGEQSTTRLDDVDEESQHDTLHHQQLEEQQQQQEQHPHEEFQDDTSEAGICKEHEHEQEQGQSPKRGAWGRLGSLRALLGNSFNNKNNKSSRRNNIPSDGASSNDNDSSISSMTESHYCYRSAIANGDDPCGVEDVALDESKYPWDDIMGGLVSGNKKGKQTNSDNTNRPPVVDNLSMLENANDNRYKYPWDREDGSQGSLAYL
jgi:hypothetical protein